MKELVMTLTKKGQVTIPKEAREHLGISEKGKQRKITLVLVESGQVILRKPRYPDVASLRGVAGKLPKSLSWDEMREIGREEHLQEQVKAKSR
jgi:AbrB family looped-hinge helix DNA binding protein